jgi:hypothetical protein
MEYVRELFSLEKSLETPFVMDAREATLDIFLKPHFPVAENSLVGQMYRRTSDLRIN